MSAIGSILLSIFGLVSLWALFYFGLRRYRLDNVRLQLFALRNELFLLAANGELAFDQPAYMVLRNRINALIRFAHIITAGRILLIGILERSMVDAFAKQQKIQWQKDLDRLDMEARRKILGIEQRVHLTIAKHVITGNVILFLAFLACKAFVRSTPRQAEAQQIRFASRIRVDIIEEQASIAQRQEREIAELQPA
jgi:hypothetical protein